MDLKKIDWGCGVDLSDSRQRHVSCSCEKDYEILVSIRGWWWNFLNI
jgi:hypothetical protein